MIQLLKNTCIGHLLIWVSITLAAPEELREDISKSYFRTAGVCLQYASTLVQRGTMLDALAAASSIRAASFSAAINSQNRLFRVRGLVEVPSLLRTEPGQGQARHLRTTASSQACMHMGSGTSGCEAEG